MGGERHCQRLRPAVGKVSFCRLICEDADYDNERKSNLYFRKSCIFASNQISQVQTRITSKKQKN